METLQQIWQQLANDGFETDKGSVHDYISVYEEILKPYIETEINVLEIGIFKGNSLRLWERYFTKAKVYGIDCDEQPHCGMADLRPMINSGKHNIVICDATNADAVEKYFKDIKFDVIIEDAAHNIEQQIQIFNVFKKYLSEGSIYISEDIQDIDKHKWLFQSIDGYNVEILDRRNLKGRYDNVMVIIKNK